MNSKSIILSVSVQSGCYRHLQVPMNVTLERLAEIILSAFGFDNDHGHAFFMDNKAWSKNACYYSQGSGNAKATTKRQKLQSLELEKGSKFKFLFDFGDEWLFQCAVLGLSEESVSEPLIIKSKGEAPPQYPESCDVYEDEDNDEAACGEESGMPAKLVPDAELLDAAFAYKETRL